MFDIHGGHDCTLGIRPTPKITHVKFQKFFAHVPESAILARARARMLRAPPCVCALPRSSNGAFAAASSAGDISEEVASVAEMAEPAVDEAEEDEEDEEVEVIHAGPR